MQVNNQYVRGNTTQYIHGVLDMFNSIMQSPRTLHTHNVTCVAGPSLLVFYRLTANG